MKVLLTGALGSLGSLVLEALLERGHTVIAFDVKTSTNVRIARAFSSATIHWGDIRDRDAVRELVNQVDAVIHLAAIIVPTSELQSDLAYQVNVVGTQHIVDAIGAMERKPLLAYCSSFAVFGPQGRPPPRTVDERPIGSDHYTRHKIAAEEMVQSMASPWVILRLGGMADSRLRNGSLDALKYAMSMAATNRFEYVHPKDAATAFANVLTQPEADHKVLLIGGGGDCQIMHKDMMNATLGAFGLTLPDSYFGQTPLYADWVDSGESQRLLQFQNHSFADFKRECYDAFKLARPFVKPLAPVLRQALRLVLRP